MSKIRFRCKCGRVLLFDFEKEIEEFECKGCKRKFRRIFDAETDLYEWEEDER